MTIIPHFIQPKLMEIEYNYVCQFDDTNLLHKYFRAHIRQFKREILLPGVISWLNVHVLIYLSYITIFPITDKN